MRIPKGLGYICLSLGVGATIGGIIGYICKRKYDDLLEEEIKENSSFYTTKIGQLNNIKNLAVTEIHELRQVCRIICNEGQYETIFEKVKYDMKLMNEIYSDEREMIESWIDDLVKNDHAIQKQNDMEAAEELSDNLGYMKPDEDGSDGVRLYGEEKREAKRQYIKKKLKLEEADMDEYDDYPPMTPDGDIDDEAYNEDDDDPEWTSEAKPFVYGDDIVKDEPYVISEHQFTYGKSDYTKVSLDYLALDDTILDEDDDVFDQSIIGPDNLKAFETDDCPSIFIRNDQLQIDYEIMWSDLSYIHNILDYPESEVHGRRIWRSWETREE